VKSVVVAVAIVALGILVCAWFGAETSKQLMQGELGCEGAGGMVINIGGNDYAVNAMAGPRYPPIESIWNKATQPNLDRDRLLSRGLTLCDWEAVVAEG
jgi:hypothetical protein